MWEAVIVFILELHPTVQTLIIIGIFLGLRKGVLKLPFIDIEQTKKPDYSDHDTCIEARKEERSKGERLFQLRYFTTVYEQMSIVETVSTKVNDLITDEYNTILSNEELEESKRTDALRLYQLIIDGAVYDSIGYLRRFVKKNHIAEMTDIEFQSYIHNRTEELRKLIKKYIDRHYLKSVFVIDRKVLAEYNSKLFYETMQVLIADMFIEIRVIAESSAKKIKAIEDE